MRSSTGPSAADRLLDLVSTSWKTQAVRAAARLRICDHLSAAPSNVHELAAAIHAHPPSLERLLLALTSLGILRERIDAVFEITETGALLCEDAPDSLRDWVLHWSDSSAIVWPHLDESVRTGRSARALREGTEGFDHLIADPAAARTFHRAMAQLTRLVAESFAASVSWDGARRIVDVGGGYGELLTAALAAAPEATGVLFDTGPVLEEARLHLRSAGLESRCELVAGDFCERVPAGDTLLLKSVLHDWEDSRAATILSRCRSALPPEGRLILIERILPQRSTATTLSLGDACSDLHMLVQLGGRERSENELRKLLGDADLRVVRIAPLNRGLFVLEAIPGSSEA